MSEAAKKPPGRPLDPVLERQGWAKTHLERYADEVIDIPLAKRLANQFNTASDDEMPFEHLFKTFAQYQGWNLNPEMVFTLAYQIAGREAELNDGPLVLYSGPVREEWVPMEIMGCQPCPWRGDGPGQEISFLALGGHPSGHTLKQVVPEGWLRFLAYQIGFSKKHPFHDEPWMLIGLRMWGYLVPDVESMELNFEHWGVSEPVKRGNTPIIAYRTRFLNKRGVEDPFCPMDHDHDCNECSERSSVCPGAVLRDR